MPLTNIELETYTLFKSWLSKQLGKVKPDWEERRFELVKVFIASHPELTVDECIGRAESVIRQLKMKPYEVDKPKG